MYLCVSDGCLVVLSAETAICNGLYWEISVREKKEIDNETTSQFLTNEEVQKRLDDLKNTYSSGKFWNHDPNEPNNPASVTNTPCTHDHDSYNGDCNVETGSCGCNYFGGGIQCYGFAMYMAFLTFGSYPDRKNAENKADPTDFGNGWKKYSADAMTQIEFEPGDIIRSGKHSAIVYSFDKTNEHLIVGECWGNPQNLAARCRIAWGAFNYEWTLSTVLENMEYVFKAPKKVSVD